jgi:hypothetical protein
MTCLRNVKYCDYRFGFNGQEKTNEIAGVGNHNTALFWEYDTRLGRRWNTDPVDQVSVSNYATFGNNPIVNVDVLGDKLRGTTAKSAERMDNAIKNDVLKDKKFDKLKSLLTVDSKTNQYNSIDKKAFKNATKGLNGDENVLAKSIFNAINEDQVTSVEITGAKETVSDDFMKRFSEYYTGNANERFLGETFDQIGGGAMAAPDISNGGRVVGINMNAAKGNNYYDNITGKKINANLSVGEMIVHEALGHNRTGIPLIRAVQMENVYHRVQRHTYFNGSNSTHNKNRNGNATGIPNEFLPDYIERECKPPRGNSSWLINTR